MLDKIWGFLFDIIVAVIVMFLVVFIYFGFRSETVISTLTKTATEDFVTDAKKNGYLSLEDYQKYMGRLSATGLFYDIDLKHTYTVLEPEYRMRTLQEVIDALKAAWTGENLYTYREVTTNVPQVNDPVNTGTLNTETNESVMAAAQNNAASPDHVHTEECYTGHHHETGSRTFTHTHAHDSSCASYPGYIGIWATCGTCGKYYQSYANDMYWTGTTYVSAWASAFRCPDCNADNPQNAVQYIDWEYSCGYRKDMDGDGHTDNTVPAGTAYNYKMDFPQLANGEGGTWYNGCYSYHVHGQFQDQIKGSSAHPDYIVNDLNRLNTFGMSAYCNFPQYIYMTITESQWNHSWRSIFYGGIENGQLVYHLQYLNDGLSKNYYASSFTKTTFTVSELVELLNGNTFLYLAGICKEQIYGTSYPYTAFFGYSHYAYHPIIDYQFNPYTGYEPVYADYLEYEERDYDSCKGWGNLYFNYCSYKEGNPYTWNLHCGLTEDTTPDCGSIITNIVPTHATQTVAVGDPLITTVTLTHLDGSTTTQIGTCDFSTAAVCTGQTATITYHYTIDGVSYSKTCDITVSVIRRTKTCPKGHVYNLNNDGSDPGCPYCNAWVQSIQLVKPSSTNFTVTIGTTLEENGITILVTYMDGHTETLDSGYEDNLDTNYLGTMQVTIGYKGATLQCRVTTVCAKMTCSICGYEYELWPDGTDPGCPRCISKIPVFTGNVLEYEKTENTDKILERIFEQGIYRFHVNDTFDINIKNQSSSSARNILKNIFPSMSDTWISFRESVKIRSNEK